MSANGTLTEKQNRAVVALLGEASQAAAARRAGVSERTLTRWLSDPAFKAAVTRAEESAIDAATRRLVGACDAAITLLSTVVNDESAAPGVRVRAAGLLLENLLRLRELRTIEQRLAALEAAQHGQN